MKIELEFPYQDFIGYTVINPEKRKNVCLVHKITKQRTTISFARYLMSVHLKRFLLKEEHVDHIDNDKTNDEIYNLQILTQKENNIKKFKDLKISRKIAILICPNCKNEFKRFLNQVHFNKNAKFSTCSKKCLHDILKKKYTLKELETLGKNQLIKII